MKLSSLLAILLTVPLLTSGCRKAQVPEVPRETYVAHSGAVPFDLNLVSVTADGTSTWDATYSTGGKTARFKFVLNPSKPIPDDKSMGFGDGRLIAVAGSDPDLFLDALRTNLEAKHKPVNVRHVSDLSFEYADLGNHQSRNDDGSFQSRPSGNWRVMKLFLAEKDAADDAEMFFNLNPALKKGEFSIKDSDYGDDVLARLAKVL